MSHSIVLYIDRFQNRFTRTTLIFSSVFLTMGIGVIHYVVGNEYSLFVLYLLPIMFVAWVSSRRAALLMCILCFSVWIVLEFLNPSLPSSLYAVYWNFAIRFAVLLFFAWIVNMFSIIYRERGDAIQQNLKVLGEEQANRKYAETITQLTLEQYREMVEDINETYIVWDQDQKFLYCSPNILERTGYGLEELKTLKLHQFIVPEDYDRVVQFFQNQSAGNRGDAGCIFRLQCKDKRILWIEMSTRILRDAHGTPIEFRSIARDITLLKETEKILRQRQERVSTLFQQYRTDGVIIQEKEIDHEFSTTSFQDLSKVIVATLDLFEQQVYHVLKFSSLASHELRTPLTVLRIQLEHALQAETSAEVLRENITSIYDEILSLNQIVSDLLDLSQLMAGTFRLKTQQVEIRSFLQEFYDEGSLLARSKNISLFFQLGPDVTLPADPLKLRQVLFNLLDNAIKNTPEKGKIHLSSHLAGDHLVLQIEDNGYGISEEEMSKIFDPFYKGADANSNTSTGLGLTLVKGLIEAHHGRLDIQSKEGIGTTAIIQLPLHFSI